MSTVPITLDRALLPTFLSVDLLDKNLHKNIFIAFRPWGWKQSEPAKHRYYHPHPYGTKIQVQNNTNKVKSRFWRVLTMVYNTQNYWVFQLFPSSGILESRKHDVLETGSLSILRWKGEKTPTQLSPLERANLNHWTTPVIALVLLHLVMFVAKNFYLLFDSSSTHVRALSQFLLCIFLLYPAELARF
jgi:hypothetical protein